MKGCGACERELPDDSYSEEQRRLRQSIRRCNECVAANNELVLMKRGRTRAEEDTCALCQLPLPVTAKECMLKPCCMKIICNGCILSTNKFGHRDCPFCRAAVPDESEVLAMTRKRVAVADPTAICFLGANHGLGLHGLKKDTQKAIALCEQAAALGNKEAHHILGDLYKDEVGGPPESIDKKAMAFRHYEEAAMRGHIAARFNLGVLEYEEGHLNLAIQHFLISAKMGHEASMINIKELFAQGFATENTCTEALLGYKASTEKMFSTSRELAKVMGAKKITKV